MNVVFDDDALDDLGGIFSFIAKDNARAAELVTSRILERIEKLEIPGFAHMGRRGLDPGTRELLEFPYIIVYEVQDAMGRVVVLSIVHGAQDRRK